MKYIFLSLCLLFFSPSIYSSTTDNEMIRVGIVDTGLDLKDERFIPYLCSSGHKDFTHTGIRDTEEHGTHVTGLIIHNAQKSSNYCLIILKYFNANVSGQANLDNIILAFKEAIKQGATIVNYSGGGPGFSDVEKNLIHDHPEVKFIVSAGNDHANIDLPDNEVYPACYHLPNIYVVGNGTKEHPDLTSNFGNTVQYWENGYRLYSTLPGGRMGTMSGTSMSAAVYTGKLLYENSK